uniref:Uncharacterized protein n=1 Tax=Coturnix japonica TaxID=93934 RepID=A0A8C2SRE7_COTJA
SRCTAGGDGVRCVCMVNSIPDSSLVFELPTRNQTVSDGHRDFTAAPPGSDGSITGILTLRGPLEPRLLVLCAARNRHGTTARQLRFHHPGGLVWAKVGPVGAVVAFAIVIAVVCYLSQSRPPNFRRNPPTLLIPEVPLLTPAAAALSLPLYRPLAAGGKTSPPSSPLTILTAPFALPSPPPTPEPV